MKNVKHKNMENVLYCLIKNYFNEVMKICFYEKRKKCF